MEENFNIHLGKKLRMRRLSLGLTQTKVAQAINVTFQQIQKYEKGTNGVSSNRLMQLSQFLKVPIIYFFEEIIWQVFNFIFGFIFFFCINFIEFDNHQIICFHCFFKRLTV